MATLNIKNFPDELYLRLREQAESEHRSVTQQVIFLIEKSLTDHGERSILELEGLGKEIWEGIDPAEYIAEERDSWR